VGIRVNVEMVRSWRRFRNITMVNANKCSIGKKKKKKKKKHFSYYVGGLVNVPRLSMPVR
jgi:hypothetical protein